MLDFELLRTFVAVADCGGFPRAAERLNLTQSTPPAGNPHILPCPRLMVWRITGAVT
jgi:hypothetical protein